MSENQLSEKRQSKLEPVLKLIPALLGVAAFVWGIYTYRDTTRQQLAREEAEAQRTAETRRIEATRPYLDKQLALYTEATRVTATIATSSDRKELENATKRFWQLYWGELGMVERDNVERAMQAFRIALEQKKSQEELGIVALRLAHACRDELAVSWGTDAWKR